MSIHRLERQTILPLPLEETFAFFQDPANLAKITPPSLAFRITSDQPVNMRKGAEIRYRIAVAGVPLSWTTVIEEYEPPFYFVDRQASGPYKLWVHRHTFRPHGGGTLMEDRVDYELPFGPLGEFTHALFVRRQLETIFDYRAKVLSGLLGGDPRRHPATAK